MNFVVVHIVRYDMARFLRPYLTMMMMYEAPSHQWDKLHLVALQRIGGNSCIAVHRLNLSVRYYHFRSVVIQLDAE